MAVTTDSAPTPSGTVGWRADELFAEVVRVLDQNALPVFFHLSVTDVLVFNYWASQWTTQESGLTLVRPVVPQFADWSWFKVRAEIIGFTHSLMFFFGLSAFWLMLLNMEIYCDYFIQCLLINPACFGFVRCKIQETVRKVLFFSSFLQYCMYACILIKCSYFLFSSSPVSDQYGCHWWPYLQR